MLEKDEQIEKKSKGKGGKGKVGEGGDFSRSLFLFLSCSVPREANGGAHTIIKREKKNPNK